jgi:hypothetical protein
MAPFGIDSCYISPGSGKARQPLCAARFHDEAGDHVQVCGGPAMLPAFSVVRVRGSSGALLSSVAVDGKGGGGLLLASQDKQDKSSGKGGGKGGSSREAESISAADTMPLNTALQSKVHAYIHAAV